MDPRDITWGGGTAFGDNLYIVDKLETATWGDKGEVTKIDLTGNKTPFCGGLTQPIAIEIDRTGNYNNLLYMANGADDKILSIGPSGGVAGTFSDYPYAASGTIWGIGFDTTGTYGGRMFTAAGMVDPQYSGLFKIDTNGSESRYAGFQLAYCVTFDDTPEQFFGGKMFAVAQATADDAKMVYQVNGYNDTVPFLSFDIAPTWPAPVVHFGPDSAMYIMEWDQANENTVISRVTPIPEPATLLLLGLGGLILRKK